MADSTKKKTNGRKSVRKMLLAGVFWRILAIEMILLAWSLGYRAYSQGADAVDLFWFAIRILILIAIIIAFVTLSLRQYLNRKIILPLEAISEANRNLDIDAPHVNTVQLPDNTPEEILQIADTRKRMLEAILRVSAERLKLVGFIRDTFGRYLSKKVVDEILASPEGRKIGGRRETVTILMADLRGFTAFAETYDPEKTVNLLNRFFGVMAGIIIRYDGLIDEFLGDGILTIFGVPERHENDPARAVACALEMQNALIDLNSQIARDGYPPLEMGIGINTGPVIVGNIGSEIRSKYGIVGSTVNIAARIESMTTGGQVFIGESTYRLLEGNIAAERHKTARMKGLAQPLVCYPITAIESPYRVQLKAIEEDHQPTAIHLPLTCWTLEGKTVAERGISGHTMEIKRNHLTITTEHPLPVHTDLKLQFNFCTDVHCFAPIYAKIVEHKKTLDQTLYLLRITAIDAKDRDILQQWIKDVEA